MSSSDVALPFRVGARTLWTLRRRLVRTRLSLGEALAPVAPGLPALSDEDDGYLVTACPAAWLPSLSARHHDLRLFVRQHYRRLYARLDQSFDDYLAAFSGKSRSTLKRKVRKFADRSGGTLDLRCYRAPEELRRFHAEARLVSRLSYQERLLDAGLPDGAEAIADMCALAARDMVRAWLLRLDGKPIAYLYAPAEGEALVYAYLGYDPAFADLSPGTVLQYEAMRQLMGEGRFALFDFTEGEGRHKRLFATDGVESVDLLLLRPRFGNLAIAHLLNGFDQSVELAKHLLLAAGGDRLVRRVRR